MKTLNLSLCSVVLILIMAECENNTDKPDISQLTHSKTIEGGCNIDLKSSAIIGNDTAVFTIHSDTLDIYVGVNYACCTPFSTSINFRNDSIRIDIKDICQASDVCYCRCMCYYTWDFKINGFENSSYPFKITYDGQLAKTHPVCIQEGILIISENLPMIH